jgi:D-beta-D-heptose 7-phosphate kinase/D-beta-D-heptose 1-phosphate adenosyltransferase
MTAIKDKIKVLEQAREACASWQLNNESVVFTNGCFDLIHPGHALYLESAKKMGDRLVVGLNSDLSVRRLKGDSRPIQDQMARAIVLASMAAVDLVVIFEEDTPMALIKSLRPDTLVKGGDWQVSQIVGGKEVQAYGGEVKSLMFEEGFSTTDIIQKIKDDES